ncbi:MAG: hypothetical protein ACM3N6_06645 [Betaproteobacteria bacterium]
MRELGYVAVVLALALASALFLALAGAGALPGCSLSIGSYGIVER